MSNGRIANRSAEDTPTPTVEANTEEDEEQPQPSPIWVDEHTALLLGQSVLQWRSAHKVSREGMIAGGSHTEEWVAAIERGELAVTAAILSDLEVMSRKRERPMDFRALVEEIQEQPLGAAATQLVPLGSSARGGSPDSEAPAPQATLQDALSPTTRLLIVAPVLVLAAFATLSIRMLGWTLGSSVGSSTESALRLMNDVLLPAVLVGTVSAFLAEERANAWFRDTSARLRTERRMSYLKDLKGFVDLDGLPWSLSEGWDVTSLSPHIIPKYRASVATLSQRAQFTERVEPMLNAAFHVSWICAALALGVDGLQLSDLGPVSIPIGIIALLNTSEREADKASDRCFAQLSRGLGWKLKEEPAIGP